MAIDSDKIINDSENAEEAQKVLRDFILENIDKPRCATMLLFIGCLTGSYDDVKQALDNGADVDHVMTVQEKRILKVAGFNIP